MRAETGGGFVEERRSLGYTNKGFSGWTKIRNKTDLGSELNGVCGSLAVLDAQRANSSIGIFFQTANLKTLLDTEKFNQ